MNEIKVVGTVWKTRIGTQVIVKRQANLLHVVYALGAPGRFAQDCTAGNNSATNMPMMAITTSSSTSVKPGRHRATCEENFWSHFRTFKTSLNGNQFYTSVPSHLTQQPSLNQPVIEGYTRTNIRFL